VDEVYLYIAPLFFGGADAPTLADGVGLQRQEAIHLQLSTVETLGDGGIVVHYVLPKT
jgi:riboflavin biosynthesis pyrimidine reductase